MLARMSEIGISDWYLVALAWALVLSLAALVYVLWPARPIEPDERVIPARHRAPAPGAWQQPAFPPVCPEADSDDALSSDVN